jgi:hypothetical protein
MKYMVEYTDLFCGEANYSWVIRKEFECEDEKKIVRMAKEEIEMTGVKCDRNDFGDLIELRPRGYNSIIFILPIYA